MKLKCNDFEVNINTPDFASDIEKELLPKVPAGLILIAIEDRIMNPKRHGHVANPYNGTKDTLHYLYEKGIIHYYEEQVPLRYTEDILLDRVYELKDGSAEKLKIICSFLRTKYKKDIDKYNKINYKNVKIREEMNERLRELSGF